MGAALDNPPKHPKKPARCHAPRARAPYARCMTTRTLLLVLVGIWGCSSSTERGAPRVGDFSVSPDTFTVDRVAPSDDGMTPDGHPDGVFELEVSGPIAALAVITTDEAGLPAGGQQWDTFVGEESLPEAIGTHYEIGRETWVLGVEANGETLNRDDGSLSGIEPGTHRLRLFASNESTIPIGTPGLFYRVLAWTEDGTLLTSAVIPF